MIGNIFAKLYDTILDMKLSNIWRRMGLEGKGKQILWIITWWMATFLPIEQSLI